MDEQLLSLIAEVCNTQPGSHGRQKQLHRLLILIQQLPGIYKCSHQDYPEAYNRTLEWVCKNIDRFEARPPGVQNSLVTWINGYLKWRIRDLYTSDNAYEQRRVYAAITEEGEILDPLELKADSTLSLLDRQIAQLQQQSRQRQAEAIQQYIEQDPEGILAATYPRKNAQCHCQLLAIRLLLQQPPEKIADVAREFNLNNQTLYSHWKQKCLPLLKQIGQGFAHP
ncbi:hypothetical protein [Gloeothece verrucosa]|uniref:Sigma-70 family RNA polymerase sigma factor n=1 Tax=Gloeothece verrucosa (strain PCC 7822) TaxID=497965 RepID=E0U936_GLOV7|nr:hypothetical protein [Gloeothece verrucosa]ADN16175.1 hypothetical protein Cyan7822_4257 [Gloeothece verrucosa PCC 7822]